LNILTILSPTLAKPSRDVRCWRSPEVPLATFDSRLRLQNGLWQAVNGVLIAEQWRSAPLRRKVSLKKRLQAAKRSTKRHLKK